MFKFISFVLVIGFMMVCGSEDLLAAKDKPPLSQKRIAGEIAAGYVGGFIGAYAGLGIGALLGCDVRPLTDPKVEGEAGWGTWLSSSTGIAVGVAAGVYLVGSRGNETGSFISTLGGSVLGVAIPMAIIIPMGIIGDPAKSQVLARISLVAAPVIGATIGFNLTRRYDSPPASQTALIYFGDGQMRRAVPTMYSQPDSFDRRILTQRVDLVEVRF